MQSEGCLDLVAYFIIYGLKTLMLVFLLSSLLLNGIKPALIVPQFHVGTVKDVLKFTY